MGFPSVVLDSSRERPDLPNNLLRACKWYSVDGLKPQASVALLGQLGVLGEPAQLQTLAESVNGHPLLLQLIAGWLMAEDEEYPHVDLLDEAPDLLTEVKGAHRHDSEASVALLLEATLGRLQPTLRTLLQRVSVYRRPFTLAAAQAMVSEGSVVLAKDDLRRPVKRSLLIEQRETVNGQRVRYYLFQPLIQQYLQRCLGADLPAAHQQAADFYYQTRQPQLGPTSERVETANYEEVAYHLCELGNYGEAITLWDQNTDNANRYSSPDMVLQLRGYNSVRAELFERIANAWQPTEEKDHRLFAYALEKLGDVLQFLKRSEAALEKYETAIGIYRQVGDRLGEANTLKAIGDVQQFLDRREEALSNYETAIDIYRQVGARLGEANVMQELGKLQDDPKRAISWLRQAQDIYVQIGDVYSQSRNLLFIALGHQEADNTTAALDSLQQSLVLARQINFEPFIGYAETQIDKLQSER